MNDDNLINGRSAEELFPAVYEEVRALAAWYLNEERSGHTLQPTALANEVFLKMGGKERGKFTSKTQFMAAAAQAIRRVLVDHARGKRRQKRGGGVKAVPIGGSEVEIKPTGLSLDAIVELEEALEELEKLKPRAAKVVVQKFFGGMTLSEIAKELDIADSTVSADWDAARAWLKARMSGE